MIKELEEFKKFPHAHHDGKQENIIYSCYQFPVEEGMKHRCCECGGLFEEIFVFNRQSKTLLFPSLRKFLCKNCKEDYWEKVKNR